MLTNCPDCGYLLRGLPATHACPECGYAYTADMEIAGVRRARLGLWVLGLIIVWRTLAVVALSVERRWANTAFEAAVLAVLVLGWGAWRRRGRSRAIVLTREHLIERADGVERQRVPRSAIWSVEWQLSTGDIVMRDRDGTRLLAVSGMGRAAGKATSAIQAWLATKGT
ncbi:MAG: hypothetical protein CHACPFDD_03425 [Phycisphaerae bacterium]|nr:hypothetical protein [Phycisphaerae bacterium]